jgi:hypothetical protein
MYAWCAFPGGLAAFAWIFSSPAAIVALSNCELLAPVACELLARLCPGAVLRRRCRCVFRVPAVFQLAHSLNDSECVVTYAGDARYRN